MGKSYPIAINASVPKVEENKGTINKVCPNIKNEGSKSLITMKTALLTFTVFSSWLNFCHLGERIHQ